MKTVFIFVILVFCGGVFGATYYVDTDGIGGEPNDANAGDITHPWKTIGRAMDAGGDPCIMPGDTVYVRAGTYAENIVFEVSGTSREAMITLMAYPGDECQGSYGGPKSDCQVVLNLPGSPSTGAVINVNAKSYIHIEGFEIADACYVSGQANGAIYVYEGIGETDVYGIDIINNYIYNCFDAIYMRGYRDNGSGDVNFAAPRTHDVNVSNNEIYFTWDSSNGSAICISCVEDSIFSGNYLHRIMKDGFDGTAKNCIFERNTMFDSWRGTLPPYESHPDAFDFNILQDCIFRYNWVSDWTQGIYLMDDDDQRLPMSNIEIYGNVFFNYEYDLVYNGTWPAVGLGSPVGYPDKVGDIDTVHIYNNVFGWAGDTDEFPAISIATYDDMNNIVICNNIFYRKGVSFYLNYPGNNPPTNLYCDYNFYAMADQNIADLWGFDGDSHSIEDEDPCFVNYIWDNPAARDFNLMADSNAIDAGDPDLASVVTLPTPYLDMARVVRPVNGLYDIGAYEYTTQEPTMRMVFIKP